MKNGEKKGSASAPTPPSRGSNKSSEETAVNEQHDTIAPALTTMPDFEKVFFDLEELIDIAARRVKTLEFLVDGIDNRAIRRDPDAPISVDVQERDALHSTARDAALAVDDLSHRFGSVVAQIVEAERALLAARESEQINAGDAFDATMPDPLLTMIGELRTLRAGQSELEGRSLKGEFHLAIDAETPVWRSLVNETPPARTAASARAALNEALSDIDVGKGPLASSLIRSAIAYLESAHVQ